MGGEVDRDGPVPLFEQIAVILVDRISSGELGANRPIPSEKHLCQEFGISRGTARKAVTVLRKQGLVITVPGRGTFVIPG